ncbi:hypothetical protein GCM10027563_19470 [Parasphingorhabdus pacifica]
MPAQRQADGPARALGPGTGFCTGTGPARHGAVPSGWFQEPNPVPRDGAPYACASDLVRSKWAVATWVKFTVK